MLLSDYINQHGAQSVARLVANDPAFSVFNLMWNSADEILPACQQMGLNTVDDVISWVHRVNQAIGNHGVFASIVDPDVSIDVNSLQQIKWADIHAAIAKSFVLEDGFFISNSDSAYRLPTKAQWEELASKCPSKRKRHAQTEAHDCDDFAKHFLGWLASKGLGNLACGQITTIHKMGTSILGAHAVCIVIDSDKNVWQIEPQNGKLYPANYAKLGGFIFADRITLARCFF